MESTDAEVDLELRQTRLSRFGRVLAGVTLGYVIMNVAVSKWIGQPSFNLVSVPLLVAIVAFGALWLLLRGTPRSPRIVRTVELATLFVGTTAFSSMAVVLDLTASPDMIARTLVTYLLLAYVVYVPSTARRTLISAGFMTVPCSAVFTSRSANGIRRSTTRPPRSGRRAKSATWRFQPPWSRRSCGSSWSASPPVSPKLSMAFAKP